MKIKLDELFLLSKRRLASSATNKTETVEDLLQAESSSRHPRKSALSDIKVSTEEGLDEGTGIGYIIVGGEGDGGQEELIFKKEETKSL